MGEFLALSTALIWAGTNISMRYGVIQKNPGVIMGVRLVMSNWGLPSVLAILVLLCLLGFDPEAGIRSLNLNTLLLFSLDGLLTKVVAMLLLATAFGQIGASRAAAIRASDSVFTCILSFVLLGENITPMQTAAAFMVAGGAALANLKSENEALSSEATSSMKFKGGAVALAAGACFALGNIARGAAIHSGGSFLIGVLISYLISFLVYGLIYLCSPRLRASYREIGKTSARYYRLAGIADVIGTFTFFASFTLAPVWLAVTLKSTQPLMVMGLSAAFLRKTERINVKVMASSLMVVIGTCIIVST